MSCRAPPGDGRGRLVVVDFVLCFGSGEYFSVFFSFFYLLERTRPAASTRPFCLMYHCTSTLSVDRLHASGRSRVTGRLFYERTKNTGGRRHVAIQHPVILDFGTLWHEQFDCQDRQGASFATITHHVSYQVLDVLPPAVAVTFTTTCSLRSFVRHIGTVAGD